MKRLLLALVFAALPGLVAHAAIINFTGYEYGAVAELHNTTSTGTGAVNWHTGANKRTGDYSLDTDCPGATDTCWSLVRQFGTGGTNQDGTAAADSYVTLYVYPTLFPAANDEPLMMAQTTGAIIKGELRVNSAGVVLFYTGTGTVLAGTGDGSAPLALNAWNCVQVYWGTGTTGPFTVTINGDAEISATGNLQTGGAARWSVGKNNNRNSQPIHFYFDDVVVDNSSQPTCGREVRRLDVDSDSATAGDLDWTVGAGAGADYLQVAQVPGDGNTTYLLSTSVDADVSGVGLESASSAGITGTPTIHGVKAFGFFRRDNTAGSTQGTIQLGIRSGSSTSDGTDTSIDPGVATSYDARQLLFFVDPVDGLAWTVTDLNGLELRAVEAETTDKTRVTALHAHVLLTPDAGGGGGGGLKGLLLMGLGGGAQ